MTARTPDIAERLDEALAPEFRVLRPMGEGAVSRVYLASEPRLARLVAVKVLRSELATDELVRQRFEREARAAARVVHPNVVGVHRVGELADGLPYLVMECVEGRTLADLLAAQGKLSTKAGCRLLEQIASALAAAHARRVIHRDLRPGNVLIEDATDRAVLTDFGIAGIRESGGEQLARLTREGESLGDPRYASPEQLLGEPVTEAADVYSLGVLAYEVLSGAGPFPGSTAAELLMAHLREAPRSLRELTPETPAPVAALLEQCLAKRPEQRPRAAALATALAAPRPAAGGAAAGAEDEAAVPVVVFLAEVRRRRVYRAAATYLAAAFVFLQAADLVLPALGAPDWLFRALVIATTAGFPVALVLAWLFDLTKGGLRRTRGHRVPGGMKLRSALAGGGIALSMLIAGLLAWLFLR